MRHRRAHLLTLLLVLSVVALTTRSGWLASKPYQPNDSERAALIDAFLRSEGPGAIVHQRMTAISSDSDQSGYTEQEANKLGIPAALEQLSLSANVPRGLSAAKQVVSSTDIAKLSDSKHDFWSAFHETYGDGTYLVELSPIAFSSNGKDAVFVASCYSGGLSGEIGLAHLRLEPQGWVVVNFDVFIVS